MSDVKASAKYREKKKIEGLTAKNYYFDAATLDALEKMKKKFSVNPSVIVNKAILEYAERHSGEDTETGKIVTLEELSDRINMLKDISRNLALCFFRHNPEESENEKIIKELQALKLKPKELKTKAVYNDLNEDIKEYFSSFEEYCSFIFAFIPRIRKKNK